MSDLPDYYAILEVSTTGSPEDIKKAYKRAALKWHPDRVPVDSPERSKRTNMFQRVNDAYYTLCDPTRRKEYDEARRFHGTTDSGTFDHDEDADEEVPRPPPSWANMFGFGRSTTGGAPTTFENEQFRTVFEEMMSGEDMADENMMPTKRFWSIVGGISGAAMGFIVGDVVGAVPGAIAGAKLGAIRDAKGKSVYQVFQSLPQNQKARILSELAAKIFSGAIS
ncbi:uncharacterized protein Z518_10360 [Rhinocladiella mackenziei CBS 650.93]|uniref:J domain-containing protein n=1 Tax=Rhinocladiella mackenziei CBS 650.93 TaxID=1442369 RepID=A0A0D2IAE8_9EURO|nr:uncharacterized protein Z518_10360 [Rhinocladiella mackenziei CBS 650.93]KIX00221.1 hypothetical protein Z518_10360 [Rhinocladiella mackenziei CBS 650.93]